MDPISVGIYPRPRVAARLRVRVAGSPFGIDATAVTNDAWAAFIDKTGRTRHSSGGNVLFRTVAA